MIEQPSILEEYQPNASKLYFLFGGISAAMGMPPFEFYNSAQILDEHKIFLRDFYQAWYQRGLQGLADNIMEISALIQSKIDQTQTKEVYFVGNSMGGYAAILFASLANTGRAIAFSPQTFISPLKRIRHLDVRWPRQILRMYFYSTLKPHIWDIKGVLTQDHKVQIDIFVSPKHRWDYIHAQQLRPFKQVHIHTIDKEGHNIVKHLRNLGELPAILSGQYKNHTR